MLSAKEKLYLLINSLVENCRPYSGRSMYDTECPGFVYSSVNSFLKDCLLSVIDLPNEDEAPARHCDYLNSHVNPQEEFINLASRFRSDNMGKDDLIIYFPEIVLTPELIEIIKERNKITEGRAESP